MEVIDNFLSPSYFNEISNVINSPKFEWFSSRNITDGKTTKNSSFGFCHPIFDNGFIDLKFNLFFSGFLFQLLDQIQCNKIIRSRIDMTTYQSKKFIHEPHVDFEDPYISNITTIFYITDNKDADTIIYDKKITSKENICIKDLKVLKKISPKKNRLVYFDGSYLHTGHSPTNESHRILINSNFTKI